MKKLIALSFTMILLIVFSSCKTHERCPAYGNKSGTAKYENQSYVSLDLNYKFDSKKYNQIINKPSVSSNKPKPYKSPTLFN